MWMKRLSASTAAAAGSSSASALGAPRPLSFAAATSLRLQRAVASSSSYVDPLADAEGGSGRGRRSSSYPNGRRTNAATSSSSSASRRRAAAYGSGAADEEADFPPAADSHPPPRRPTVPAPQFRRAVDHHNKQESARFVKREQYTRIFEFLRGLRKSADAADHWEVAVASLRDAASRGAPMTSELVAEAIEACYAAKQYDAASDLFFRFHFDYGLARGPQASLAFLRVCAATGQFEAAKRVVEWVGGGGADVNQTNGSDGRPSPLLADPEEAAARAEAEAEKREAMKKDGAKRTSAASNDDDGSGDGAAPLDYEALWMRKESSAAAKADSAAKKVTSSSSAQSGTTSAAAGFALTADMMTLFLRSALTLSRTADAAFFATNVYPRALATYSDLRLSARNAPTIVTNPLLVEALVRLHAAAGEWAPAYTLLLKTVRLLAVDSSRSASLGEEAGGGGASDDADHSDGGGSVGGGRSARQLRKLVQYGDEDAIADKAARDATTALATDGLAGDGVSAADSPHDALLSDGSLRGSIMMSESALDDILVKFGVKKARKGGDAAEAASADAAEGSVEGVDGDDGAVDHSVSIDDTRSLDDLLGAAAAEEEALLRGMRRGKGKGGEGGSNDDNDRARDKAMARLRAEMKAQSEEVRGFSEVDRHQCSSNSGAVKYGSGGGRRRFLQGSQQQQHQHSRSAPPHRPAALEHYIHLARHLRRRHPRLLQG